MKSPFLFLALAALAAPAFATTASYADFSSTSGLTVNLSAAQAGNVLRLVPSVASQAGTAFLTAPVPLSATTDFSTAFAFNVTTDPNSGLGVPDGFSFILQNAPAADMALGGSGQGMGYAGLDPSVAVLFRGRAFEINHQPVSLIGVVTGGTDPGALAAPFDPPNAYHGTEGAFYEQNMYAWIDYTAGTHVLSVYLSDTNAKPVSAIMSTTVDVFGTLGSQAYVGFGAGNGGAYGTQDILSWNFTSAPVPEPSTTAMLTLGVLAVGLLRRRRNA